MDKHRGFLQFDRQLPDARPVELRVNDYKEFVGKFSPETSKEQSARCMDCGVPFCHGGCPLGNNIPDFNEAVFEEDWERAFEVLNETNNFPEFTGRICPAPCESACVLGINQAPVAIEYIEKTIAEKAFELGLIQPHKPTIQTGKRVAVVGSGPSGMAAAAQLNQAGHEVVVYERDAQPGGLLRYGIPDFKLEKWVVERRINLLKAEGITFTCNTEIGRDISFAELHDSYDAILLAGGALKPRDMALPGRELAGVHFAMDYLTYQNRRVTGEWQKDIPEINAKGKHVLVIGGGDTGSDCIGTANRQGAKSVTQITWGNQPPTERTADNPWPLWPMVLETTSSHEEGCERSWNVLSKAFLGDKNGQLRALQTVEIEWSEGRKSYREIPGTEKELPCELALIAVGFVHPLHEGMLAEAGVALTDRG
ncbi:MAG: glutamate synthase subunit beta, partial [Bacteroidota bacterium]